MYKRQGHVNYNTIPGVIYTTPEVASIGKTEEQLKEMKQALRVVKKEMNILNTKLKRGFGS